MVELLSVTKYYAVDIGSKSYSVMEEYDSNNGYTRYEVECMDGEEVSQREEQEVLGMIEEAKRNLAV